MGELIRNFFDLDTWRLGHLFVLQIYKQTKSFPPDERFGVTSQIRRAASSITANVAEGYERYYFKDKIRFYHTARASLAETQNFIFLARDLGYWTNEESNALFIRAREVGQKINGLIRYTENLSKNN